MSPAKDTKDDAAHHAVPGRAALRDAGRAGVTRYGEALIDGRSSGSGAPATAA